MPLPVIDHQSGIVFGLQSCFLPDGTQSGNLGSNTRTQRAGMYQHDPKMAMTLGPNWDEGTQKHLKIIKLPMVNP